MFFVYNIFETSCFFVLEKKNNRPILSAVGAYWNPWAPPPPFLLRTLSLLNLIILH